MISDVESHCRVDVRSPARSKPLPPLLLPVLVLVLMLVLPPLPIKSAPEKYLSISVTLAISAGVKAGGFPAP